MSRGQPAAADGPLRVGDVLSTRTPDGGGHVRVTPDLGNGPTAEDEEAS